MGGGYAEPRADQRPVVYCLMPRQLAPRLHDLLRHHFRDDPNVEVVVERRRHERRRGRDRRLRASVRPQKRERRRIRALAGRRIGERRAALISLDERPPLPRRADRHAGELVFVERLEPSTQELEDRDTARLVTRLQAGEHDAFEALYARFFDRVYGYLRVVLRDPYGAEDATQQAFIKLFEALPRYERRRQPFRAWMFKIVRNLAIDELQRSGRLELLDPREIGHRRDSVSAGDVPDDWLEWLGDHDLALFVQRLPLAQRQVLSLRYLLDLSDRQIAEILDRSPADVRMLQSRALRFLRARLTSVGRGPKPERRTGMRRSPRPAQVVRARRWALLP